MRFASQLGPTLLLGSLFGVFVLATGCGSGRACTSCTYKTGTYTVSPGLPAGATIVGATMHTEVGHTSCPYTGYTGHCTATLDINVLCKTTGAGPSWTTETPLPNGQTSGSTIDASVDITVNINGTVSTLNAPVIFGAPTSNSYRNTVGPCSGEQDPTSITTP